MAENIVINGTTYENVDTITVKNTSGDSVNFEIKSDEGWQPNPTWWDIKTILENDTRDYAYKVIYLYTNSTIAENGLALGGVAYETSDGVFYDYGTTTTAFTHTWDLSKDKPCYIDGVEAYKTRYVIVYSNSYVNPTSTQDSLLWLYGLDTINVTNMNGVFQKCRNLKSIPKLDTSRVIIMSSMFNSCYSLQTIPELDTSSVTAMGSMFNSCYSLQTIPEIDTSGVTGMGTMFFGCYNLKSIPKLDTSNVENMNSMFYNCYNLESIPKLDITSATSVGDMLKSCYLLTNLKLYNIKKGGLIIGSGTSYGHLLSQESLIHTIKQLWDYSSSSSTYTLTMGTSNTPKLANVYVKLITATDEMIAEDPNINSKMPCEVCESTDEGAMLILDYATAKGWTIS